MHFSWISEVFWLHPEGREECVSRGVKALEDAGGSRGWKCYFVLFESWLWAQVCCDLNLEESHSVLGWLQRMQCSQPGGKAAGKGLSHGTGIGE